MAGETSYPRSRLAAEMQEFRESLQQLMNENAALEAKVGKAIPKLAKAAGEMAQSYDGLTDSRRSAREAHALFEEALENKHDSEKQLAAAFMGEQEFLCFMDDSSYRARVAACLMVKPSLLQDCRSSVRTYFQYHLISSRGPKFDHIFVFLDTAEVVDAVGNQGLAGYFGLNWLFDGPSGNALETRISLLQCRSVMPIDCRSTVAEELVVVHEAARGGELIAKQIVNSECALRLSVAMDIDWLICNLDIDEAMVCSHGLGTLLARVCPDVWQVTFLNHEAVPEISSTDDYFAACTLFKKNPALLDPHGKSKEQTSSINFWRNRIKSVRDALDPSVSLLKASHFLAYVNGKSAVHVASVVRNDCYAAGSHRWRDKSKNFATDDMRSYGESEDAPVVDPTFACILHYVNCEGLSGFKQKINARREEKWNPIPFHRLCQRVSYFN